MNRNHYVKQYLPIVCIFLVLLGLIAFNGLMEPRGAEARRALVTFEMMQNGDMMKPYLHGHPYFNKPPLYNWVLAFFFTAFGSMSEWVLRLPGVLSLVLTSLVFYLVGRPYLGKRVAMLGALASLTATDMLFYGSINAGEIDLFYALITSLQVLAIFWFRQKEKWLTLFMVSYFLAAIGTLTKGLPSLAFQALTLMAYLGYTRSFKRLFGWQHFVGIGLLVSIVAGYFIVYAQTGDALAFVVNTFKQASQRSANEYGAMDIALNLIIFPFEFIQRLLPWSLALVFLFNKTIRSHIRQNPFIAFIVVFFLVNIPIYWTAPELRIRYTYMFFPFCTTLFIWIIFKSFELKIKVQALIKGVLLSAMTLCGIGLIPISAVISDLTIAQYVTLFGSSLLIFYIVYLHYRSTWNFEGYWSIVFTLVLLRMVYNIVGMPYTSASLPDYSQLTSDMIKTSAGKPIHYYGRLTSIEPNFSLFGHDFYRHTLLIPQDYSADFAYYDALYRNEVMDNTNQITSGDFYIVSESEWVEGLQPLDTIPNMIGGQNYYFCKGN